VVGCTSGSREVPGKKKLVIDDDDDDSNGSRSEVHTAVKIHVASIFRVFSSSVNYT